MGQYIQEGRRDIFETVVNVVKPTREVVLEAEESEVKEKSA